MNTLSQSKFITLVVIISFAAGAAGGTIFAPQTAGNKAPQNNEPQLIETSYIEESATIETIEKVAPSVVSIVLTKELSVIRQNPFFGFDPFFDNFFWPNPYQQQPQQQPETRKEKIGGGSGFIVGSDGLVVTNKHVVNDEEAEYTVVMSDGKEYKGEVVSKDPIKDLAVVKIVGEPGEKLPAFQPVKFGKSSALKVGQRVLAIGNALAEFENTVTSGIISAKGREIIAGDGRGSSEALSGLLQTDAAINPGNSGGPLIDLAGEVIGVNVAIAESANGIGFAIPADEVKPIVESVRKHGRIVRPILGVRYQLLTEEVAKEYLQTDEVTEGALIIGNDAGGEFAVIPGGPADKAGLKGMDVIIEVDGEKITQDNPLQQLILNKNPGDKVKLKIWRDGNEFQVTAELGEA